MGWQVDAFHVQQEEGGLYVPLLDRIIPDNQYCIEDFHTNGSLVPMVSRCVWRCSGPVNTARQVEWLVVFWAASEYSLVNTDS